MPVWKDRALRGALATKKKRTSARNQPIGHASPFFAVGKGANRCTRGRVRSPRQKSVLKRY
jgi:hypothetical protein